MVISANGQVKQLLPAVARIVCGRQQEASQPRSWHCSGLVTSHDTAIIVASGPLPDLRPKPPYRRHFSAPVPAEALPSALGEIKSLLPTSCCWAGEVSGGGRTS